MCVSVCVQSGDSTHTAKEPGEVNVRVGQRGECRRALWATLRLRVDIQGRGPLPRLGSQPTARGEVG